MSQPREPRLRSKDAILVHANGRPVAYFNTPLPGFLGWLLRLVKRMRHK
ncbi:MAG: hypothetical protein KJ077_39365 [Anaerolineae bacterium]|nr:hypothetical protein [Anaerolineae bacterium]